MKGMEEDTALPLQLIQLGGGNDGWWFTERLHITGLLVVKHLLFGKRS